MSKTRKITVAVLAVIFALSMVLFVGCKKGAAWSGDTVRPTLPVLPEREKPDDSNQSTDNPFEAFDFYLNVSDMKSATLTETTEFVDGKFILAATSSNTLVVDGNEKTPIDLTYKFSKRLKTSGASNRDTMERTISFYLEKPATVSVYALSSSSTDITRKVGLFKNGNSAAISEQFVEGSANTLEPLEFKTTEAGSYYLAATVNGVNFYFIGVKYTGEAAPIQRKAWAEVAAPTLTTAAVTIEDGAPAETITVGYNAEIGLDGGDKLFVYMLNDKGEQVAKSTVLAYGSSGTTLFTPKSSGVFTFKAELERVGEATKKASTNEVSSNHFDLKLKAPQVRGRTGANGVMTVIISKVLEADKYTIEHRKGNDAWQTIEITELGEGEEIARDIAGYAVGDKIQIKVTATRTSTGDSKPAITQTATLRSQAERDWQFNYFGQSTKSDLNGRTPASNIFDGVTLFSCSYDPETKYAEKKGGKFTYGSHDGISFYYTAIKANEEDFRLKARVVIDYLNPTPDGQEGFALLVRDAVPTTIGDTTYNYTNSVAAIATKLQYDKGSSRETITDGLGARFVTGVKSSVETPEAGTFVQKMYPFMSDPVVNETIDKEKDGYILEVEKVNNTYTTRYYSVSNPNGEPVEEYTLYPDKDGKDQLLVIDKDYVYVGFAVARACSATFEDIEFETKERSTAVVEVKPEEIVSDYRITSPSTSSTEAYKFAFLANADGKLTVKLNGANVYENQDVKCEVDYYADLTLVDGQNAIEAIFTPTEGYVPGENQVLDSYAQRTVPLQVVYRKYYDANTPIYVAPHELDKLPNGKGTIGVATNKGTKESPIDLLSALNHVLPGQTIFMLPGTYNYGGDLKIERGNNGTAEAYKTLRAAPGLKDNERPVIDFQNKGKGMKLWGNYWHLSGFDLTKTAFSNKGIQLGGKHNILEDIKTYYNGDSGISVSGKSTEPFEKWPAHNLILNCTSYMNKDQAEEDADGFAAKLYCGDGNVFRGCIAYCNADDGWDLYAKTETGKIGAVWIDNCVTFGNGFNIDGTATKGNGNGFKLGGESLSGLHTLTNSISFGNKLKGIDSNSCPDDIVQNCTSVYNGKYNYAFYSTKKTNFLVENCISVGGNMSDQVVAQLKNPLKSATNYFYQNRDGVQQASNVDGATLDMTIFKGWDNSKGFKTYLGFELNREGDVVVENGNFNEVIAKITRSKDGSINMNGLFELVDQNATSGAKLGATTETKWANYGSKGCKSEISATGCIAGFVVVTLAMFVLLKRQKNNG